MSWRWSRVPVCHSRSHLQRLSPVTRFNQKLSLTIQKTSSSLPALQPNVHPTLETELTNIRRRLSGLLGSAHPSLEDVANQYVIPTSQIRSLLVLLFSQAVNGLGNSWGRKKWMAQHEQGVVTGDLDHALAMSDTLHASHPCMQDGIDSFQTVFPLQFTENASKAVLFPEDILPETRSPDSFILPMQLRLAQITEMIYVASLLHDLLDETRPAHNVFSFVPTDLKNSLAILGGDFLLGRASTVLSRLGESRVVELIGCVISNIMEGKVMKATTALLNSQQKQSIQSRDRFQQYFNQAYLADVSLLAKGARAAVILGGCDENEPWCDIAESYGRNLGFACRVST
jgi:hexaprenyl-diphosphate synthase